MKNFTRATDAEIWAAFRAPRYVPLNDGTCCQALRLLRELGMSHICYYHGKDRFEVAKLIYCPECGKKL